MSGGGGVGHRAYDPVKRVLDVIAASVLLVVTLPVQLIVALLVAVRLGRPVLFAQPRPGRGGKVFTLYKFRTMRVLDPTRGLVSNEERMTKFGRSLRSTSLDELPSLWNVLRGDMSMVGPRPLRLSYLPRYSREQARRHEVRPGITGFAQVLGRNSLGWDERLALDVIYVNRRSFRLDLSVLARTISAVLSRNGVNAVGKDGMSEFFGPEQTNKVQLVPLAEEHLNTRVEWLSHPSIRAGISISFMPDLASTREWFFRTSADNSRYDWVGVDPGSAKPVSMCGITLVESEATLYIYVAPESQGQGIGIDTMTLLIARCRALGVALLNLETAVSNEAAISLYKKLGFIENDELEVASNKLGMSLKVGAGHSDG